MEIFGINAVRISSTSQTSWGAARLRVASVLDVTGSMPNTTSSPTIQTLIDQLSPATAEVYVPRPVRQRRQTALKEERSLRARGRGKAAENWIGFDAAYEQTDWSKYKSMPAFSGNNRGNAYRIFLELDQYSAPKVTKIAPITDATPGYITCSPPSRSASRPSGMLKANILAE